MGGEKLVKELENAITLEGIRPDAIVFLREGLDYTVHRVHGEHVRLVRQAHRWLQENDVKLQDLADYLERKKLPRFLVSFVRKIGDLESAIERLNLHVGGEDLCWGLRALALERYGLMAPLVLRHWGIRSTRDFGRIVFGLVDAGELAKQDDDDISDFDEVYPFDAAFDRDFKIQFKEPEAAAGECADDE